MAGCKLTSNIKKDYCGYAVAGVKSVYLINHDSDVKYTFGTGDKAQEITAIEMPDVTKAYKVEFVRNTASFSDELAENGNGGKYRTHTVNFSIDQYDYNLLNEGDALSLGKYTAIVVDKSGRTVILGRLNGLSATAFNYASGAAEADAIGWTVTMAGTETEIGPLLESESVIKDIVAPDLVVTP